MSMAISVESISVTNHMVWPGEWWVIFPPLWINWIFFPRQLLFIPDPKCVLFEKLHSCTRIEILFKNWIIWGWGFYFVLFFTVYSSVTCIQNILISWPSEFTRRRLYMSFKMEFVLKNDRFLLTGKDHLQTLLFSIIWQFLGNWICISVVIYM